MLIPLRTVIQDTISKHILNDLINSFGLIVNLRMVGWTSDKMGAKAFMQLFIETCHKDRSSVRYDGIWNTIISDYVGNV
jgi:hypothetical protein